MPEPRDARSIIEQAQQAAATARRECEQARQNLARLQSGARYVRYKDDGEQEYLDDKGRAEEVARTQKIVADSCK